MRPAIIFDDGLGQLSPLTDLRPAFDIRTGAITTLSRLTRGLNLNVVTVVVPPSHRSLAEADPDSGARRAVASGHGPVGLAHSGLPSAMLLINGRCPLGYEQIDQLSVGQALIEAGSGHLIAAAVHSGQLRNWQVDRPLEGLAVAAELPAPALLSRPWHVRTFRDRCLAADLGLLLKHAAAPQQPAGVVLLGKRDAISIASTGRLYPSVVLDAEPGPIVIDDHAVVRPGAVITGPAYIGPHSTVLDRAVVRPNTVIGPHCKVAGEISGTIFQGYANKAHDGFLGDSYVGEWANLGAGTTNSNLLNTYGEVPVRSQPGGPMERTGETFMGCIIGDHAKFAICTRIMTGAVIHTGAMYAATAPVAGCIPPFAWITDEGKRTYRLDKFTDVASTVMARRKVTPSDAYLARLAKLHSAAAG